ncbi:hypothetical protein LSTR_LSTR003220 [Laodelphax striatellus]|uniref:Major facilitator superfamily associated domain-containing protein n=1 Tax=Laodelphax striatellus TaxID=195883 RepID=A0A482XTS9_LAOST|nr:hypothetical protein LSTR_LSTR003220 [Laodelphax striatellus]
MADKLHEYQGVVGRLHSWRDKGRTRWQEWRESRPQNIGEVIRGVVRPTPQPEAEATKGGPVEQDYSHIYRRKTRGELVRVSAAVMGIEFSYAAETAFVSPTLLQIGVDHQRMTLVWALSPLVGFFLTPVLGSMSDRCRMKLGRRRPFILALAVGVFLGLMLVPNGERLGHWMGDYYPSMDESLKHLNNFNNTNSTSDNSTATPTVRQLSDADFPHPWGIFFTVLGTVLLDFDADACQSPARAYLLDVTVTEDHAKGLSTFTVMAGLGGFMGYAMGGINWDATAIGEYLGGHVKAVFSLITIIFVVCVLSTVTAFKEMPLDLIESDAHNPNMTGEEKEGEMKEKEREVEEDPLPIGHPTYGAVDQYNTTNIQQETAFGVTDHPRGENNTNGYLNHAYDEAQTTTIPDMMAEEKLAPPTLKEYLMSILYMPKSMKILCLTNLFCWMSHVCYSLYFTDFVGEAVFKGDPKAPDGTKERILYEEGVRFGCWGMSMYSLSCACYSTIIERLIRRYKARSVYVGGLLFYSFGMFLMAVSVHPFGVILFSWTAGVMYSTLFTMPYLLIAHYHANNTFEITTSGDAVTMTRLRGLGTDVAIVSSMVFLAQFMLSICMGSIISAVGTTTAVAAVASFLAFCGAITATQVMYLDL